MVSAPSKKLLFKGVEIKRYLQFQLCISAIGFLFLFAGIAWTKEAVLNNAPGAVGLSGVKVAAGEDAITDLNNRGYMLLSQGNVVDAEQIFKQASEQIDLRGQVSPNLHIAILNGLGLCDFQERKFADAEKDYLAVKNFIDTNNVNDGHVRAMVSNNLGQAYRNQFKFELAEPSYQKAIKLEKGLPNPDAQFLASIKCNLGLLYFQQKHFTDAEPFFTEGMSVLHNTVGDSDPGYRSYIPYYKAVLEANGHNSSIPGI